MVYKCLHKTTFVTCARSQNSATQNKFAGFNTSGGAAKSKTMQNKELEKELHKPISRNFEKRRVHSSFKDNILMY